MKSKGHYIDGHWLKGVGDPLKAFNPATKRLIWQGNHATFDEINLAFMLAKKRLNTWSLTSFEERAHYVLAFGKYIENHQEALASCISEDNGKPLWEARMEVKAVIDKIPLSIQAYEERTWHKVFQMTEANASLRYKPQGVVAVLGPFNFPAHLSNGHIVPALLAGNCVLYKPSELTPKVAEWILQAWHESQIPAGVINGLQGGVLTGQTILSQDIQAVYFTGSYKTGLSIHQQFANKPEVILALEMGGNNPLIIDTVVNQKAALYQTLMSSMVSAGQRCSCARRLMVPKNKQGDDFLSAFTQVCQAIKIGAFDERPEPFMGPVISPKEALKHLSAQEALIKLGGQPLCLMTALQEDGGFLSPGLIDMTCVSNPPDEEIFAPLLQIYRYKTFDEALNLANQTRYGLVAGLFSDNEDHYQQFYQTMKAGLINWNRPTTGAASNLPFGGVGLSGNHRPSAYFAADYCAYPVTSMEQPELFLPDNIVPGVHFK